MEWIKEGGGPPTQEPSPERDSSGGQQGFGEEGRDPREEAPRTEQYQTAFLPMKLSHLVRTHQREQKRPLRKIFTGERRGSSRG